VSSRPDDLGDVLRDLAGEGPSDEGLLASVHAASARAAVRRRVMVSSAAAVALLAGGIGLVAATGSDGRRVRDQVFGVPDRTPGVSAAPTPAPSAAPSPGGSAPPVRPPGLYRGRAVSAEGKPVAGLYVYALPQGFPQVAAFHHWLADNRPATRTSADGTFAVPCPSGPVLLTSWPFHQAQEASTPNWAAVFVGGATAPGNSSIPACRGKVETTEVAEGAVVQGTVAGPGLLCPSTSSLVSAFGTEENSIFSLVLSNAWTHQAQDGSFRLAGLPVGTYWVAAFNRADPQEDQTTGYARTQVHVTGPGPYQVELAPTRDDEDGSCPAPTPDPTASPGAEPEGEPSPTPVPSPS
jgi:hypothetical protein